eukprot:scaffold529_cov308-Pinguiococcus_pyrenoidosus.AAC.35
MVQHAWAGYLAKFNCTKRTKPPTRQVQLDHMGARTATLPVSEKSLRERSTSPSAAIAASKALAMSSSSRGRRVHSTLSSSPDALDAALSTISHAVPTPRRGKSHQRRLLTSDPPPLVPSVTSSAPFAHIFTKTPQHRPAFCALGSNRKPLCSSADRDSAGHSSAVRGRAETTAWRTDGLRRLWRVEKPAVLRDGKGEEDPQVRSGEARAGQV